MNGRGSFRFWALLIIGVAVLAGIGLLMSLLGQGPGAPAPLATPTVTFSSPTPTATPTILTSPPETQQSARANTSPIATPAPDSVVASVNGRSIEYASWTSAVLLDQVMSSLAGQPAPDPDATLERLINEELVLEAFPPEQMPTPAQVEQQIAQLERALGVDDAGVVTALQNVGLTRAVLEQTVERLLVLQQGLLALQAQGYDTTAWLVEQRASADILVNDEPQKPNMSYVPVAQSQSPLATPPAPPSSSSALAAQLSTPTPPPATEPPLPDPGLLEAAPDFTLPQVGGGALTLSDQLAQGPVVLVFFQRCG